MESRGVHRGLSLLFLCASLAWGQGSGTFKLGLTAPFSGSHALKGASLKQGVDLAVHEWNAKGGVLGRRIELVRADDKDTLSLAAPACSKLITEDNVTAIIGPISTEACFEAAAFCQRSGIPMLAPVSSDPKITEVGDLIFRASTTDLFLGGAGARYAIDSLHARTATCIYNEKDPGCKQLAESFWETFTTSGRQMLIYEGKAPGVGRLAELVAQVVAAKPDVVYLPKPNVELVAFAKNLRSAGFAGAILGADGWGSDPSVMAAAQELEGVFFTSQVAFMEGTPGAGFSARFRAAYHLSADSLAAHGYDAANVLLDAVRRSGSGNPSAIQEALFATDLQTLCGRLRFDQDGDAVKSVPVLAYVKGRPEFQALVEPSEPAKTSKVAFKPEVKYGAKELHLGLVAPLSGEGASFGRSAQLGAWLAVAEWNARGGVIGRWIKLNSADDQGDPSMGAKAFRKLIVEDRVAAIVGTIMSKVSLVGAPVCESFRMPMVSPTSTNPKVTEAGSYIFRACFIDPYQGVAGAKFAFRHLKAKRAACLFNGVNDYSRGLSEEFQRTFKHLGGEMVAVESHASGLTDFKGYLSRILMAEPEVIFISDYYNETATIAKQVRALGYKGPLIGGDGWDSPKLVELAGEAIEGCFFINHFAVDDPNRASKEFVANFIVKYRIVPDAIAVLAYDSVNLVLEAVQRAESVEGAAIQAALLTAKTETVCGSLTFDAYRNPIKPAVVLQIKEGKHVYYATVEP